MFQLLLLLLLFFLVFDFFEVLLLLFFILFLISSSALGTLGVLYSEYFDSGAHPSVFALAGPRELDGGHRGGYPPPRPFSDSLPEPSLFPSIHVSAPLSHGDSGRDAASRRLSRQARSSSGQL